MRQLHVGYVGEQRMASIRRLHPARLLFTIEGQSKGGNVLTTEGLIEALPQRVRLNPEGTRGIGAPKTGGDRIGRQECAIVVALHFTERDGGFGDPAILVENRIVTVLPALIEKALVRLAAIFDETVAIEIAMDIGPVHRSFDIRPDFADELHIR